MTRACPEALGRAILELHEDCDRAWKLGEQNRERSRRFHLDRMVIDAALVKDLVEEQFPDLAPATPRYLAEGWDFEVYEVQTPAETLVFRFPKRRQVDVSVTTEAALLPLLEGRVAVAVPVVRFLGRLSPRFAYQFAGYTKLCGTPGNELDGLDPDAVGGQLGSLLGALHAFPEESARSLGLDLEVWTPSAARQKAAEAMPVVRRAASPGLRERCDAFVASEPPSRHGGPPCLVHGDLTSERVLLDADRRVVGILDWSDSRLGDPAEDFAGLLPWLGEPLLEATLSSYPRPIDPGLCERARYLGVCRPSAAAAMPSRVARVPRPALHWILWHDCSLPDR